MTAGSLSLLLQTAASLGLGSLAMRVLRLHDGMAMTERLAISFAIGLGGLGWLIFPMAVFGFVAPLHFVSLFVLLLPGLYFLRPFRCQGQKPGLDVHFAFLLLLLAGVLLLAAVQAAAPPADGDSMAYHFARIKAVAQEGRFVFLPQAIEGTAPMLVQMTYLPAYVLGGERTMVFWTMLSGAGVIFLFYILARIWLAPCWSLLLTLLLATTPSFVYGWVSGQVEVRNALFVLLTVFALIRLRRGAHLGWAAAAGLGAGFFAGAKVFGLLFLPAAGTAAILRRSWLRTGAVFSAFALAAGCEIYLWNFQQSGDPLFPMLSQVLHRPDSGWWTAGHLADLKAYLGRIESPVSANLYWFFVYPFKATFDGLPMWESGRTGFGAFALLALPFALLAALIGARFRKPHPLWDAALLILLFYTLWFFLGGAQRLRHLLPLYPVLLLGLGAAAFRLGRQRPPRALIAAAWLCLSIQLAGFAVYSLSALKYLMTGEAREAYLERSIPLYSAVPWINGHLGPKDRLLITERQLLYHLDVPYFFAHPLHQAQIDLRPEAPDDVDARWLALGKLGISHLMLTPGLEGNVQTSALHRTVAALLGDNCLRRLETLNGSLFASRTLAGATRATQVLEFYELTPATCRLEQSLPKQPDLATNTLISHKERQL